MTLHQVNNIKGGSNAKETVLSVRGIGELAHRNQRVNYRFEKMAAAFPQARFKTATVCDKSATAFDTAGICSDVDLLAPF